jgi:hypothetical protein
MINAGPANAKRTRAKTSISQGMRSDKNICTSGPWQRPLSRQVVGKHVEVNQSTNLVYAKTSSPARRLFHGTYPKVSLPYILYPITHYALRIPPIIDSWFAN